VDDFILVEILNSFQELAGPLSELILVFDWFSLLANSVGKVIATFAGILHKKHIASLNFGIVKQSNDIWVLEFIVHDTLSFGKFLCQGTAFKNLLLYSFDNRILQQMQISKGALTVPLRSLVK
jgi:hypothetical protein